MLMDWLKKAPTSVVIAVVVCCFALVLGTLAGFIYLTAEGADTTEYTRFVNTIANLIILPIGGLAAVASVSAARSASKTEEQTNGTLTALEKEKEALEARNALLTAQIERARGGQR
jgi:ABC-type spermidine/putrescine transport system permease subunit II